MNDWIFALALYIVVPVVLASGVAGGDWKEVANAYCIFWAILLVLGFLSGGTIGEKIGWPLIFGMFLSIPGIPILVVICRLSSLRLPWFA